MMGQNRPHNATNVFTNLKGAVPKTQVVKMLDELTKDGTLAEKAYGKQKLYCAGQDQCVDPPAPRNPALLPPIHPQLPSTAARTLVVAGSRGHLRLICARARRRCLLCAAAQKRGGQPSTRSHARAGAGAAGQGRAHHA